MNINKKMGLPKAPKPLEPHGGKLGDGAIMKKKINIVYMYNTNSSPLWQLPIRVLTPEEEEMEDKEFESYIKQKLANVDASDILVIVLAQDGAETGIVAFDCDNGQIIPI